jgi:hypothetical protein
MSDEVTRSTGSVFEDLGFAPDEAENLRVRSILMVSMSRRTFPVHPGGGRMTPVRSSPVPAWGARGNGTTECATREYP